MLRGASDPSASAPSGAGTVADVLRFLATPRWIALTVAVLVLVPAFLRLSEWQLDRSRERSAANAVVRANIDRPVEPLAAVPVGRVAESEQWRRVSVTGRWDAEHEVLVRNRSFRGRSGYLVVTPLRAAEGPALLVARGFVPATGAARTRPDVPPPQSGEVVVVARLRVSEPARTAGDLPPGQVLSLNAGVLAPALGYRVVDGYGELVSEQPAPSDAPVPTEAPTLTPGPHLSYAVQWLLFALMAVGGWVLLARREVQARRGGRAPDGVSRLSA